MGDAGERGLSSNDRWKIAGGIVLCVLSAAFAATGRGDLSEPGEIAGAMIAPTLLAAIITVIGRLVWARGNRARAFAGPGFVLCMGVIALAIGFLGASNRGREADETEKQAIASVDRGAETCDSLQVGDLGAGYSAVKLNEREAQAYGYDLDAMAAQLGEFATFAENAEVFTVELRGRLLAVVVTIPTDVEEGVSETDFATDVVDGAIDGAERSGSDPQEVAIAGRPGMTFVAPTGEHAVVTTAGCNMVTVTAVDPTTAVEATERLVSAQL